MILDPANIAQKMIEPSAKYTIAKIQDYLSIDRAKKNYCKHLKKIYNSLPTDGLLATDRDKYIKKIELNLIFVPQNIQYTEFNSILDYGKQNESAPESENQQNESAPESENQQKLGQEGQEYDALQKLTKENIRAIVILGSPGSGKSTLMKYLALEWVNFVDGDKEYFGLNSTWSLYSDWTLAKGKVQKFPILIDLEEYAENRKDPEEDFISFWYRYRGKFWKYKQVEFELRLDNENYLVMFDGLDKINPDKYSDILNKIISFSTEYSKPQIIVTSRISGYNSAKLQDANFEHFTLKDFNKSQIERFVDSWANLLKKDSDKENVRSQFDKAFEKSSTRNLARNPEMLTKILIFLNRHHHYSLPTEEGELYYLVSRIYNNSEDKNRKYKEDILGLIAYEMQFKSPNLDGNSIDEDALKQLVGKYLKKKQSEKQSSELIKELYSDNFLSISSSSAEHYFNDRDSTYSFVHRKTLAYYCAAEIRQQVEKTNCLSIDKLQNDIFKNHWQDENRHRSLQLICSLLKPESAGQLIEFLIGQKLNRADYLDSRKCVKVEAFKHFKLIGDCILEVRDNENVKVADRFNKKLRNEIKNPQGIPLSLDAAKLILNLFFKYSRISRILADSISTFKNDIVLSDSILNFKDDPTLNWLKSWAFENKNECVRMASMDVISEHYRSKDTLEWLKETAFCKLDESIRSMSVKSISRYFDTIYFLKNIAFRDVHERVRMSVIQSICENNSKEINTLEWLKNCAFDDRHPSVRKVIIELISKYYNNKEFSIFNWLQNCAFSDSHESVRKATVNSIGKYYSKEVSIDWFNSTAQDRHESVREVSIYWIVKSRIGKSDFEKKDTLKWLKEKAFQDRKSQVKAQIVYLIAKYYLLTPDEFNRITTPQPSRQDKSTKQVEMLIEHFGVLEWIKEQTLSKDKLVQDAAMSAISKYQTPETFDWLKRAFDSSNERNAYSANVRAKALWYWSLPCKITKDHSETIDELKNYALDDDEHEQVQCTAIQALVKYYRTSKVGCEDESKRCMQNWLEEIAFANGKPKSKAIIVELMTRYYQSPETLKWLKEIAFKSNEEQVRKAVVESISQYYQSTETLKWLKDAFKDNAYRVRQVVTESIIQHYQSPETLKWVEEIAIKDSDKSVKEKAVRSVAQYFLREPITLQWLKDLMYEELELREVIIEVVVKYYSAEDSTLKWLNKDVLRKYEEPKALRKKVLEVVSKHYDDDTLIWFRKEAIDYLLQSQGENKEAIEKNKEAIGRNKKAIGRNEAKVQELTLVVQPISDNFKKNEVNFDRLWKTANISLSEDPSNIPLIKNVLKALKYHYSDREKTIEILRQAAVHRCLKVRNIAEYLLEELEGLPF